jgi:restriction system protein
MRTSGRCGATQGVFFTTSGYAAGAREYVDRIANRVVLVNGEQLAALMIEHRVGIQVKETHYDVELDEDFFD